MDVTEAPVARIFADPAFPDLCRRWHDEAGSGPLPMGADPQRYTELEQVGSYFALTAVIDGALVGFSGVWIADIPQYSGLTAGIESIYVMPEHRASGAGTQLLRESVARARRAGADRVTASSPIGGRLEDVLNGMKFTASHTVWVRELGGEA